MRYIIPHPDDLPPPYSNYGPTVSNDGQREGNGGVGRVAIDDLDSAAPPLDLGEDKNRSETPPPSYDEALAISNDDQTLFPTPARRGSTINSSSDNLSVALPPMLPDSANSLHLQSAEGATSATLANLNEVQLAPVAPSTSRVEAV